MSVLINVDRRKPVTTLRDAATHITTLPKIMQQEPSWQNAIHVLLQAADHGGPIEFARLGIERAIRPRVVNYGTSRKDPVWRNTRKLVRDL